MSDNTKYVILAIALFSCSAFTFFLGYEAMCKQEKYCFAFLIAGVFVIIFGSRVLRINKGHMHFEILPKKDE